MSHKPAQVAPRSCPVLAALMLLAPACGEREEHLGVPWVSSGATNPGSAGSAGSETDSTGGTGDGGSSQSSGGPDVGGSGGDETAATTGEPGSSSGEDSTGGSTSGADPTTGSGDDYSGPYSGERKLCVDMSNMFRTQMNVPLLDRYPEKEACVDQQAEEESLIDTPHGKLGSCGEARQNHGDGTGWENLELVDWLLNDQFNEGPGGPHYEQMLDPNMTRVACGFYQNVNGNFWINIDFW